MTHRDPYPGNVTGLPATCVKRYFARSGSTSVTAKVVPAHAVANCPWTSAESRNTGGSNSAHPAAACPHDVISVMP